ncbi:hypothetical protein BP6252_12465 [Coleophoma cylindrospora]|uniref:C2H2-type domain-containing protein n=1 Tax=Coleophoma cylindrospora TaxID=1849047 RepID=A0A3D8QGY1_9HELO|nr:hypothetical protein BP6252_12465 [Coleophoma cylindrospora]
MSSLKDIMDVDVEPLESQAYRRKEAAAQEVARQSTTSAATISTPSSAGLIPADHGSKGKAPIHRRRSGRTSKSPGRSTSSRQGTGQRRSSMTSDTMDYSFNTAPSLPTSSSASPRQSSRGSEPASEMPVKYTPVTGRTFTRAEHLRRHQLSHQKPAYPCTFEDCERAFHRPDLLARHLSRHETQGEKAFRAGSPRSRASSTISDGQNLTSKAETPRGNLASTAAMSPSRMSVPRGSDSGEHTTRTHIADQGLDVLPQRDYQLPVTTSRDGATARGDREYRPSHSSFQLQLHSDSFSQPLDAFAGSNQFETYSPENSPYTRYPALEPLPLLRIPEENLLPSLLHTQENSPWCSSASDSTFSIHSDQWPRRRSESVGTLADWTSQSMPSQWLSSESNTVFQDLSGSHARTGMESYNTPYSSPRMSPPSLSPMYSFRDNQMESVGPSAPSTDCRTLAQVYPARISTSIPASFVGRSKGSVACELGPMVNTCSTAFIGVPLISLEDHLANYWDFFDPIFPIIHRRTFEKLTQKGTSNILLKAAMAAIGTQYSKQSDVRNKGTEMHEYCKKNLEVWCHWDIQIMQALLLTEMFKIFRARKPSIKYSCQFGALQRRLTHNAIQRQPEINNGQIDPCADWTTWVDEEARRRLMAGCFIFDVHRSIYLEQQRVLGSSADAMAAMMIMPSSDAQWNAPDASQWKALASASSPYMLPYTLSDEGICSSFMDGRHTFGQTLIICSFASQLPRRHGAEDTQCSDSLANSQLLSLSKTSSLANTYLAFHYTPVHDLLAVAGESWVFARKLTASSTFTAAQARIRSWVSSLAAAKATRHACRSLQFYLTKKQASLCDLSGQAHSSSCVSDYWSLYISALICWAFGYRHNTTTTTGEARPSTTGDDPLVARDGYAEALAYTDALLCLSEQSLLTSKDVYLGCTAPILSAVKAILEEDGVGDQTALLVDAIGVLGRILGPNHGKWF